MERELKNSVTVNDINKDIKKTKKDLVKKIGVGLLALGCIGSLFGNGYLLYKTNDLTKSVNELAKVMNYDLEKHETIKTEDEIETSAQLFVQSNYFLDRKLSVMDTKDSILNGLNGHDNETYYVLFFMEDCGHCVTLESRLNNEIELLKQKNIYYYDAEIAENAGFNWSEEAVKSEKFEKEKEAVELYGTPMMVKVSPDKKDTVQVFMGGDSIYEELMEF